jgi:hypothetical protein
MGQSIVPCFVLIVGIGGKMTKFNIILEMKGKLPVAVVKNHNSMLDMVAAQAYNEWVKIARQNLHSTAKNYIAGLSIPSKKKGEISVVLRGKFPNMIEEGSGPFDMKKGFLRSPKAKMGKKGKYITIPLSLKSSGSKGASPPVMPAPIYNQAMRLSFGQSMKLPKKYQGYGLRSQLSKDLKKWGAYTWKTSPFQGITKFQRYPGLVPLGLPREKLAIYKTFRRVSEKSDKNSWIHPGFRRRNFVEQVSNKMKDIFPKLLDKAVEAD